MTFSTLANVNLAELATMGPAVHQSGDDGSIDAIHECPAYLLEPLLAAYFRVPTLA